MHIFQNGLATGVEIRVRNWSAIFFEDGRMAFPLKMYSIFGRPKQILVCQILKLVRKWPMASYYF